MNLSDLGQCFGFAIGCVAHVPQSATQQGQLNNRASRRFGEVSAQDDDRRPVLGLWLSGISVTLSRPRGEAGRRAPRREDSVSESRSEPLANLRLLVGPDLHVKRAALTESLVHQRHPMSTGRQRQWRHRCRSSRLTIDEDKRPR